MKVPSEISGIREKFWYFLQYFFRVRSIQTWFAQKFFKSWVQFAWWAHISKNPLQMIQIIEQVMHLCLSHDKNTMEFC